MNKLILTLALTLGAGLALAQLPAAAQALQDPTRPPAAFGQSGAGAAAASAPRLQSVLIAPRAGGRHVAVIDGDTVRLGDTWKGARVASMRRNEVVLVRGGERQVLRLDGPLDGVTGMTPATQ